MWKIVQSHIGQGGPNTAMFRMAFTTFKNRISSKQDAVKFMRVGQLSANIRMAAHTAILHGIRIPQGSMALFAV